MRCVRERTVVPGHYALMGARLLKKSPMTRDDTAEECPDARRVAPIRGSVSYQIYRLKSKLKTM